MKALATYASTMLYESAKGAGEMGLPDSLLDIGLENGIRGLPSIIFAHLSAFSNQLMWTQEGARVMIVIANLGRYPHKNVANLRKATEVLVKMAIEIDPRNRVLESLL
jgi:hypothetical protein